MKVKIYKKQFKMKYYVSYGYNYLYNDYFCYTLDNLDEIPYTTYSSYYNKELHYIYKKPTLYKLADVNDYESILLKECDDCIIGNSITICGAKYDIKTIDTNLDNNECIIYVGDGDYIQPTEEETRIAEDKYKELLLRIDKLNSETNDKNKDIGVNIETNVEKQTSISLFTKFKNLFK